METNKSNHSEIKPKDKYDEHLSWERDVVPHNPTVSDDSTFAVIVKQLGGGAWAESVAREILNEATEVTVDGND